MVGKMIHWELFKNFKFHTNKGSTQNTESLLENEMYRLHWDFEIQADHVISAKRPYLVIVNKKQEPAE